MKKFNVTPIAPELNAKFEDICQINPDYILELTGKGELLIMSPTGGDTGSKNFDLIGQLWLWNRQYKLGIAFDSSTCFRLPGGALRSPDVSWIAQKRWEALTSTEQEKFPPIAPDFVIELMSKSDIHKDVQEKMQDYQNAGVRLGWLINPFNKTVEIYRLGENQETLLNPSTLSGENVLPNFSLNLSGIW